MVKILIESASILVVGRDVEYVDRGYLYIENGVVKLLKRGGILEEELYPELLLSGVNRLVTKGFASGFTVLSLYPLRYGLEDLDWYLLREMYKAIKRADMYFISVLSLAELASKGVTEVLVADVYLDEVARAARDVGVNVTLAPLLNCGLDDDQQLSELKLLLGRWHGRVEGVKVGIAVCRELGGNYLAIARESGIPVFLLEPEKELQRDLKDVKAVAINPLVDIELPTIYFGRMLQKRRKFGGVGIGVRPSYSIREVLKEVLWSRSTDLLDVFLSGTRITSELIDQHESSSLREGSRSSVVVYNLSEPPGWPVPRTLNSAMRAVTEGDLPIEAVIIGDDVVVDREGILTVGYEVFKKAIKRFEDLYPTLPPLLLRQQL
ncbi:MAG: hypothetical protein N3G79_01645 [Sulfolobales archaeon]|nr:hypothetical protein [Sulfolobales archaeon]